MVERKKLGDQLLDIEGKEGVEMKTLNDLCTLITKQTGFDYSNTIKPSLTVKREADTIPFIQNKDFEGTLINLNTDFFIPISVAQKFPKILLNDKILLVSISGRIGNVGLYEIRDVSFVGGAICVCRLNKDTNGRYVLYFLQSPKGQDSLFHSVKAASHANITVEAIRKTIIPLPPISEQERIVGILDTFTASIDNLKEQIAQRRKQYEYYRDQLLDLEGKDIEEILSFGNDFQLKARIGWQGLTKKEYKETGDYKLVTGTDFTRNLRIDFDNCVYVDKERYEQDEYIQLKVGDVLITKDGTLGKVAYIDILEKPATLNGGVFVVRDPKNRVLPKFLMFYLTSYHFKKWMQQNHTTGSIQHLTQKLLSSFTIPVFSLEEQQRIVSILDAFEASIQNLEAQLSQREKQYEYYRNKLLTFD